MRNVLLYAAMIIPVAAALAQQSITPDSQAPPPSDTPVYTLHSTVREVNLDVVVTDAKGRPVRGLTRENFKVFDEGQSQTLRHFAEHDGTVAPTTPDFKLPANTFTNFTPVGNSEASFIILFDSLDTPLEFQAPAYVQAIDFVKDLAPGTSVAIFDLNQRMNLVQGFTTDKQLLLNALKDRRAQPRISAMLDRGNDVLRHQMLDDGMLLLGRYLTGFPGRKNLIWFTVNIPGSINSRTASITGAAGDAPPGAVITGADSIGETSTTPTQLVVENAGTAAGDPRGLPPTATNGPQPVPPTPTAKPATLAVVGNPFQSLANLLDDTKATSDLLTLSKVVVYPVDPRELTRDPPNLTMRFEQGAMDSVAEATGGRAFYNRNGLKSIMQEIVATGSVYYTLSYTPTNTTLNGDFRKLKVQTVSDATHAASLTDLHLQYRPGYYAVDRLKSRQAADSGLLVHGSGSEDFQLASELKQDTGFGGQLARESLQASMTIGQIPPTELILNASVKPSATPLKLVKGDTLPAGNYMRDKFKRQPYMEYDVLFATDVHGLQLPISPDGLHHGGVEFVAAVYTDEGDVVNSFSVKISLNLRDSSYRTMLQTGMGTRHSIAIPVKGKYVVRLGVHDLNSDRVGALEFPMSSVNAGVAGVGQANIPAAVQP